jgi:hypothetical protein
MQERFACRKELIMSVKIPCFEENRCASSDLRASVAGLRSELRAYEMRVDNLELLLDRIMVCLSAYENGESPYSIDVIVGAIIREIYLHRFHDQASLSAEA